MQLVRQGDAQAFEVIYERHANAAFSLAYRMTGRRGAAEDVVQEAFLSLWRSGARYDRTRGSVRTWVLGIVHNRAIDALRRNLRPRHAAAPATRASRSASRPASAPTSRRPAARRPPRSARALDTLPDEQSKAIELAYFGGFSHSEIADHARDADRHREGTHPPRAREAARPARRARGGAGMSRRLPRIATTPALGARRARRARTRAPSRRIWSLRRLPAARSPSCRSSPTCCRWPRRSSCRRRRSRAGSWPSWSPRPQLLRAAGPEADRPRGRGRARRDAWRRRLLGRLRPLPAAALATRAAGARRGRRRPAVGRRGHHLAPGLRPQGRAGRAARHRRARRARPARHAGRAARSRLPGVARPRQGQAAPDRTRSSRSRATAARASRSWSR